MAFKYADRVKDTTTTTGTGDVTLSGTAPTGYQSFNDGIGVGPQFAYAIFAGSEWEVGLTVLSGTTTLVRAGSQTVLASSNSGSAVSFSSGSKTVICTLPGSLIPQTSVLDTDITKNNDNTLAAVSDLTVNLLSGRWYRIQLNAMATTGGTSGSSARIDFNGGSATATAMSGQGYFAYGGQINNVRLTALSDTVSISSPFPAADHVFAADFVIQVSSGGTLIPRFAQTTASGSFTATLYKYSSIIATDVTPL